MNRMMVDIETLDTNHDAVVLSIGAVVFNEVDEKFNSLYFELDYLHQIANGRKVGTECLKWWSDQTVQAQDVLEGVMHRESNVPAIKELNALYQKSKCKEIWCQGSDFDVPIIESWMRTYGCNPAWHFGAVRDSRTIRKMFRIPEPPFEGVKHNALADAEYQTDRVLDCLRSIKR